MNNARSYWQLRKGYLTGINCLERCPRTKPVEMFRSFSEFNSKKANNAKGSQQREAENEKRRIRLEEAHFHCVRLI